MDIVALHRQGHSIRFIEYHADNFLAMVQLGCAIILLRFF